MSKKFGSKFNKSNGFRAWTEDEENKVKVGLQEGKSIAEIALKCNRTEKAIKYRLYHLAEQDIAKGAAPDIILNKYHITKEEFAEHIKTVGCKYPECKNQISSKSAVGYCAQHLNIERVGKQDIEQLYTRINQIFEKMEKMEAAITTLTKKT